MKEPGNAGIDFILILGLQQIGVVVVHAGLLHLPFHHNTVPRPIVDHSNLYLALRHFHLKDLYGL